MRKGLLLLALAFAVPPPSTLAANPNDTALRPIHFTCNFEVVAPTRQIARQVGRAAERQRTTIARLWLGKEQFTWPKRCRIKVKIDPRRNGGFAKFTFKEGAVVSPTELHVEGSLERLLNSVLPHEVTHVILAHHFGRPVPRWADEGSAVLSEDAVEHKRHDQLLKQLLNTPGRAIPLRRLFKLTEYPRDVMALYAEGYSVTRFLVARKDRKTFLAMLRDGQGGDWDKAIRTHYGYANLNKLEEAWLKEVRQPRTLAVDLGAQGSR